MNEFQDNLAFLFRRDLNRLSDEVNQFDDDEAMKKAAPGINNNAANLTLHLIGNLNHFLGHQLAGTNYQRDREAEFGRGDISKKELLEKLEDCKSVVADTLQKIGDEQLNGMHNPGFLTGETMTIRQFLMHLYGHLNYHLGQINYYRRLLS